MKRMKPERAAALLLSVLLVFSLAACGQRTPEVRQTSVPTQAPSTPVPTPTPQLPDTETQKTILKNRQSLWAFNSEYDAPWFYTFTDLDHNGRLEVIAASTQGTGIYTYAHIYEVTPDGTGIADCRQQNMNLEGPDDWPEIVLDTLPCYYDRANDRWYYVCENAVRESAAHGFLHMMALCLRDGAAEWELLASKEVSYDENGSEHLSCTDPQGLSITAQDYDNAAAVRFVGMERSSLHLDWTRVDLPDAAPMPGSVAPAATAAPYVTASPANLAPVVTKHPTSEYLAAGGKTWFIAHAQNADSITWEFMSPDGTAYTLQQAMSLHPGLSLEVLPEDTIAVSGVPASANGWGMRARFDGAGRSVYTDTAFLYVKDYAKAYAGIIENYRAAYRSGNFANAGYMLQNGMSELASYSSAAGYALLDLDANGIPELIIEGMGVQNYGDNAIYGLYTLVDDVPIELAVSQARSRYYLLSDNRILHEGSSGAYDSTVTALRIQGDMTVEEEMIYTLPGGNAGADSVSYYFQNGYSENLPGPGSIRLTSDDFTQAMNMMKSAICTPELTSIW